MEDGGHSYSLADVEKLLRTNGDEKIVRAISHLYGTIVALSPAVVGPAGFALWPFLDAKNELADATSHLLRFLTRKREEPYIARLRRLKMAVTTLVYVAFVEEARRWVREVCEEAPAMSGDNRGDQTVTGIVLPKPPAIGPFVGFDEYLQFATATYVSLANDLAAELFSAGLRLDPAIDQDPQRLISRALERLEAAFVELCANHDELLLWAQCDSVLRGNAGLGERLSEIIAGQQGIDLGFARLQELTGQIVSAIRSPEVPGQVAALHRANAADLGAPISIADERPAEGFAYPTKAEAFVPQRFSTVRQSGLAIHDEEFWVQQEVQEDVGLFLVRSFLATDAVHRPILILGHPGSGKSLLSEMLAARLAPPFFTTIRVPLRDTDASLEIEDQIQRAVRRATGETIDWIQVSALAEAPPIVVFDGLDELLLATGNSHVNFLERLARFQERELLQGRPVRIVVTSRLTLIHRMRVADGTCVIRLLDFSPEQQQTWIDIWNLTNAAYFEKQRLRPFAVPDNDAVRVLAGQPLLLMMLAIYDAYDNSLADAAAASRGELYESLVAKFVERERGKGTETGSIFRSHDPETRAQIVAEDMDRLSIVALAMHKRARLFITKDELEVDLALYGDATSTSDDRLALSTAELLLISFFFIHRSSTKLDVDERGFAFEFLHNTFGEFLLAALLAKRLRTRCEAKAALDSMAWPEGADLAPLEAAVYDLPHDLRDALRWQLLCMRPVVLDMFHELTARPGWSEALSSANQLFSREIRLCTSLDNASPGTYEQRAVECANILSLTSLLPGGEVATLAVRWPPVVGLLRGALSFEELSQLTSGIQTQVNDDDHTVEVSTARVVLGRTDVAGATHRAAVALSDSAVLMATRLATLDHMRSGAFPGDSEGLLLGSRMLRPAVWRHLDEAAAERLSGELVLAARVGLETYPNSAIAAYTTVLARGFDIQREDMSRVVRRSLGPYVEPELVADLVFRLDDQHVDLFRTVDVERVTHLLPPAGIVPYRLDRSLIALCWLVFAGDRMPRAGEALCKALFDGRLREIMVAAPTFAWLPAAALLTFRDEPFSHNELETIEEACLAGCGGAPVGSVPWLGVIRATSLLVMDTERMRALRRSIEEAHGPRALDDEVLRFGELGPDEMRSGWSYLLRESARAAERWGLPPRRFSDWAEVFSGSGVGRTSR